MSRSVSQSTISVFGLSIHIIVPWLYSFCVAVNIQKSRINDHSWLINKILHNYGATFGPGAS